MDSTTLKVSLTHTFLDLCCNNCVCGGGGGGGRGGGVLSDCGEIPGNILCVSERVTRYIQYPEI